LIGRLSRSSGKAAENGTASRIRLEIEDAKQVTARDRSQLLPRHHLEAQVKRPDGQEGRKKQARRKKWHQHQRPSE